MAGHPGQFMLVECRRCGLVYLNPRPADIMRFYEGDYLPHGATVRSFLTPLRRWLPRRPTYRARMLTQRLGGPGRLLDVGCGVGEFMAEMAQLDWNVMGVEPSNAATIAGERFPGAVKRSTLEDASYPDASFDLVTLWDVVEHLPDPVTTLREVRRVLRPGGTLFIQTPRWGCVESRLFGNAWAGLECPRHLCIFSDATMLAALERAGLRGELVPPLVSSHWVWILSVRFWAQERWGMRAGQRVYWLLAQRLPRYLLTPFFWTLDHLGLHSLLTVVAHV